MPQLTNLREIRRKIRSVDNLRKITRAMQMVAASKLKKTQGRLLQIRAYADKISELVANLSESVEDMEHPLFEDRPEKKAVAVVLIAADKGLCGTYNTNILEHTNRFIRDSGKKPHVLTIGKKAIEYSGKKGWASLGRYEQLPTEVPFSTLQEITRTVLDAFREKRVDEVHIAFTKFVNALTFTPTRVRFIPVERPTGREKEAEDRPLADTIFEPEPDQILARLLPRFLETSLHRMFLEANSSEHAARMNAMRNATDNASEMIEDLTLIRNKVRQANITKELLDIVGGAEVLKQ